MLAWIGEIADGVPYGRAYGQAVARNYGQPRWSAVNRDDHPDRRCRGFDVVSDPDDPDATAGLREPEVGGIEVPDLRCRIAVPVESVERRAQVTCVRSREDARHGLERVRAGPDRGDDIDEAVEEVAAVVVGVAAPAVGERRRRQAAGYDVEPVGIEEIRERLPTYRSTDDFGVGEVPLERGRVDRVRFYRACDRETGLLEAEGEATRSTEHVEESGRAVHRAREATGPRGRRGGRFAHHDARVDECELIVLGAGPAGLAAAVAAQERDASFVVVERGSAARGRDRLRSRDLVTGVGGAGLYSDGKFSFAPSATSLWRLEPREALREAYGWTARLLGSHGIDCPAFPEQAEVDGGDGVKRYPSQYMPLEERLAIVTSLEALAQERIVTGVDARLRAESEAVVAALPGGSTTSGTAAVVASGRFGPLRRIDGIVPTFRRVEIGIRVEQPADSFALDIGSLDDLLDPKWVRRSRDGRYEWRTFCCCRRGEVVETRYGDIVTVSGRADGPPTERSNFGLNVRFLVPAEGELALASALEAARRSPQRVAVEDLVNGREESRIAEALGPSVAIALADGLEALCTDLGVEIDEACLHLPAIEGVGYYPPVSGSLRVSPTVWVAGDATGVFRGLVAAFVSGRLAAQQALDSVRSA